MPEAARRQRERDIKLELLQDADMYAHSTPPFLLQSSFYSSCVSTLNYVGNAIFDTFSPFALTGPTQKADTPRKASTATALSTLFNCLIIDEAGQCIEIDNFIPLRLGMNRIILVGDPEQLFVKSLSFLISSMKSNLFLVQLLSCPLERWKQAWINRSSNGSIGYSSTIWTIRFECWTS